MPVRRLLPTQEAADLLDLTRELARAASVGNLHMTMCRFYRAGSVWAASQRRASAR